MSSQERYILDNGFEVRWWPTEDPVISANLIVHAGSLHERPGEEGLAHFLEHCIGGTGARGVTPEQDWNIITNKLGYANWTTSPLNTVAQGSFLPERFPLFVDYVSAHVLAPAFDPTGVESERQAVLREIADRRTSSESDQNRSIKNAIYRGHPALRGNLGDEEVIRKVTIDDLRALHARWYSPSNMTLIVAGHRPANARQYLEDAFGSAPTGNRVPSIEPPTLTPIEKAQIFRFPVPRGEHQAPSASLYLSAVVPPDGSEDDSTVNILNAVLNSHTRLPAALRFNSGISYGVKAEVQCNLNAAVLTVRSHVDAARANEALTRITGEFNRLQDDFVAEEQLDDIRYSVRYSAATALMSPVGKLDSMAYELRFGRSYQEYFDGLHAVTPQQIMDVAQKYLPRNLDERHITSIWDPLMRA